MVMLKNLPPCSSTSRAYELSQEIIDEMNVLVPGSLVDCSDLNISIDSKQFPYLQRPAKQALARAIQARGRTMRINSAYRTVAQQYLLRSWHERGLCGFFAVARPGNSNHESGLALDLSDFNGWKPFLEAEGWKHLGRFDPPHFDFVGRGRRDIRGTGVFAFQTLWNKNHLSDQIDDDGKYGDETAKRLSISPAEGFWLDDNRPRILRLRRPLMRGGDVKRVQQALSDLGYSLDPDGVDGFYGSITETAVKKFQQDKGIDVDGVVGPETRSQLGL